MNPKINLIQFTDMIKFARNVLLSIGMDPFPEHLPMDKRTVKTNWFFAFGLWNLRVIEFLYVIYLYRSLKHSENLMGAMICLPCLICCVLSEFKITILRGRREGLLKILKFLDKSLPATKDEQEYSALAEVLRVTRRDSIALCIGFSMFIWSFNLFPLIEASVQTLHYGNNFTYPLPYTTWLPFRINRLFPYIGVNISLFLAGYVVAQYYIGSDTLLFTIINQVCMHFQYISKRVLDYQPKGEQADRVFLKEVAELHNGALWACDYVNNVFSNSIFLNFLGSAGMICLVAFRVTLEGLSLSTDLIKLIIYLFAMIDQIFILCSFGDRLIRASVAVSQSIYEHDWYAADKSYKKAMVLIMQRAQKPALLRASYFSVVSYQSFKGIMTTSYQLFAVLHTNYSNKNKRI